MGKRRRRARQASMWIPTSDLPRSAAHPFYERLNRVFDDAGFDAFVEAQCARFYADGVGRPSLAPGRYFRLLLLGYFEGLDSERAMAWRAADSLSVRSFLHLELPDPAPDHSTIRLIDLETHTASRGFCSGWPTRVWCRDRRSGSMRRRSKPTRPCGASCGAIRARAMRPS